MQQSLSYVKTDSWISLANLPDQWAEEERKSKQKEKIPVFVFGVDRDGLYLKSDKHFVERKIVITDRFLHNLCLFSWLSRYFEGVIFQQKHDRK